MRLNVRKFRSGLVRSRDKLCEELAPDSMCGSPRVAPMLEAIRVYDGIIAALDRATK